MNPTFLLRMTPATFEESKVICLGRQIAEVLESIEHAAPGLSWYASDVQTLGGIFLPRREPVPAPIGHTDVTASRARAVSQFESVVFLRFAPAASVELRPGGVWTDDEPGADMGSAEVEVRAFDTTYIEVATSHQEVWRTLTSRFATTEVAKVVARAASPSAIRPVTPNDRRMSMAAQGSFSVSGDEVRAWIEQGESIHIKASTKEGDPVELSLGEAKRLAQGLLDLVDRIEADDD